MDDRIMSPFSPSDLARNLLISTIHTSEAISELLIHENFSGIQVAFPVSGAYTLYRAHMESSAHALWLMRPTAAKARRRNALRLWCGEIEHFNSFAGEWKQTFPASEPRSYDELLEVALAVGIDAGGKSPLKAWPSPGSTFVMRQIEPFHEDRVMTWLNAWQLCSGFAHGKRWAYLAFSELVPSYGENSTQEGLQRKIRGSGAVLATIAYEAGQLFDAACKRYTQLATTGSPSWDGFPLSGQTTPLPAWLQGLK
ncbi:hypothetical protein [Arthrobacter sp. Leaf141]|uniref:hypothetical protein n=1 Tax=Arthrobacter sp. Leaf141 TaxID=1736273 RepID=UPI000B06257C|nr:hypothetical protein [Arthrobacter sp. Leaf141]